MENARKYAYFILGVNGSGKSTLRDYQLNIEKNITVIDPDQIAKKFSLNSVSAGKKAITLFRQCLANKNSFLFEGTLSDLSMLKRINCAKNHGYIIKAYFIGLDNCELHKARVAERVLNGGHYIDPNDIERRYFKSLSNIQYLFSIVDQLKVMDNTNVAKPHDLVLLIIRNRLVKQAKNIPSWVTEYVIKPFNNQ
ncbi:zeta toxin family protein [Gilliamella sp. BG6]|uniref:zeta toxin family protein n=1 Tax=Gilliamella sp. BG6 TaxID=3351512 RepID=UPI003987DBF3